MFKILVVEDDKDLNRTVCSFLNYSGYEAIGCLNANDAKDDIASKKRGFRIGVDDYMVKPVDFDELFLRIGALLGRERLYLTESLKLVNL